MSLLEMSLGGGVLIAAIIVVRALAINRLPKTAFLVLWLAALMRLVLPLRVPSPASIYTYPVLSGALPHRPGLLLAEAAPAQQSGPSPLLLLWAAVGLLLALVFLFSHLRARRTYRASLPVESPFVSAWLETHRLRRPVQVRYSDQISSPLTYGVLYPVILLPKSLDWSDGQTLSFILAHEFTHIRRFDALHKWLLAAALCLHWFNPLVWCMYVLSNRDLELSCDEAVLRQCGRQSRSSYALALVSLEERRTHLAPLTSPFSTSALKERLTAIMKSRPATLVSAAAALVLVAAVVAVFATSAPAEPALFSTPAPASAPSADDETYRTLALGGTAYQKNMVPAAYTQAQYDQLMAALKLEGYEDMSISDFNRTIHTILLPENDSGEEIWALYYRVLSELPADDPNAAYLFNTVQASLEEYDARLAEVFSEKEVDPEFSGQAEYTKMGEVFGEQVPLATCWADYRFTYRILDQDALTVRERDAFLQQIMRAAQDLLEQESAAKMTREAFQAALEDAGAAASGQKIKFTGCEVYSLEYC